MLSQLEASLEGLFKGAPKLPEKAKDAIVQWLPWINLILGLLTLWAAYSLWRWADVANTIVNYANELSRALGGTGVSVDRFTVGVWIAIGVLVVEAILYLAAFPGTRDRKKSGWNLLFYALLVNIVYGVVVLFTDYGGVGNFLGYVIGSVIGLYFLFQLKPKYN
ncbi:hypothetical protein A3F65_01765 [Candidatus Saccharibacteria bacterium RIFCSPHIGHO2_12_FULL_47_16b]|nr:MAG: hypothetical protein A3F65_01765 [Candidatus Saccharibacteria bacterium RIFCSPHIGHO2_12_FULL_47_16b]OGL38760.1 MAG: hypothetical protein A3J32_02700 [Candidatus Saccharibacteria bacterium RIFCSPLOWO2_02_FULL_46_7]